MQPYGLFSSFPSCARERRVIARQAVLGIGKAPSPAWVAIGFPSSTWEPEDKTMQIKIGSSQEFGRLLNALADEMVSACIHFRLYSDLETARKSYIVELNESKAFWSLTFKAHLDTVLFRLCKIYDQHSLSLNLRNLLDTIQANIDIFDVEQFRERLKDNPFVDSLSSNSTKPDLGQLEKDSDYVSEVNPSVKALVFWRNNFFVHRSAKHVAKNRNLADHYSLSLTNVEQLLKEGICILNRYSSLFRANTYSTQIVGHDDYKNVLEAIRSAVRQYEEDRENEMKSFLEYDS
jgi:hypothetical protein